MLLFPASDILLLEFCRVMSAIFPNTTRVGALYARFGFVCWYVVSSTYRILKSNAGIHAPER